MAVLGMHNRSDGWLVMWLEPLGEDYWLRPGEQVRLHCEQQDDHETFDVSYVVDLGGRTPGIENVVVWADGGSLDVEIVDSSGNVIECGYQRPEEYTKKWITDRKR